MDEKDLVSAPQRVATLSDVAREAGVSLGTASKALNGRGQVKAETRVRVMEAAERLSFRPGASGRRLAGGRAGSVGLLVTDLGKKSSLRLLMGAEEALAGEQTGVYLCDSRADIIREKHHLRALLGRRVDGIVVIGARTDRRPSLGRDIPVPVVYAHSPSEDPLDMSVESDNIGAGALAVQHLISHGRTRIAHITGDTGYRAARERAAGAIAALAEVGLELAGGRVFFGSWDEAWGRGATRMLFAHDKDVDAIFAGNDQIARGVLEAVKEQGLAVPEDVAIIGFDNMDLLVGNARPELTSVDMRLEETGALAVQRLFAAMDCAADPEPGLVSLACCVVQRGSTAPLA